MGDLDGVIEGRFLDFNLHLVGDPEMRMSGVDIRVTLSHTYIGRGDVTSLMMTESREVAGGSSPN